MRSCSTVIMIFFKTKCGSHWIRSCVGLRSNQRFEVYLSSMRLIDEGESLGRRFMRAPCVPVWLTYFFLGDLPGGSKIQNLTWGNCFSNPADVSNRQDKASACMEGKSSRPVLVTEGIPLIGSLVQGVFWFGVRFCTRGRPRTPKRRQAVCCLKNDRAQDEGVDRPDIKDFRRLQLWVGVL